jgi:uncharacterized protein (TIGR00730 family)
MSEPGAICVFCGSSSGSEPRYAEIAREMGETLARRGIRLVYGGGSVGLMGIMADAALAAGGEVYGVIPRALWEREVGHAGLTDLRVVETMHERKALMADLSDGFVAMPGGLGTMEELFEVWTWGQLGLHEKPYGLLNVAGYYDPLIRFLDHMVEERFVKQEYRDLLVVDPGVEPLLDLLSAARPAPAPRWIDRDQI